MRVLKNKAFHQWAKEQRLSDSILIKCVKEMEQGLYDANLGGNVYKKRLSLKGKGKSGGARLILAFKKNDRTIFIYAFSKGEKHNIDQNELVGLKKLARKYFTYSDNELDRAVAQGILIEVIL